jgi:hypothetical protein
MFRKIINKPLLKYAIIFALLLAYYFISGIILVFFVLGGQASNAFRLVNFTGIPVFLLSIFLIKKILRRNFKECVIIFLLLLFEIFFIPFDIFRDNQAGKQNDFNTIIYEIVHDYYSPIFGR